MPPQPSLRAAKEGVARIRSADAAGASYEELLRLLRPLFYGFRATLPVVPQGIDLFRARCTDTPPPSIYELWEPPAPLCKLGRANQPGRPVLYCSAIYEPVFFELRAEVGAHLAIIKYETKAELVANRVGYTPETFEALKASREIPDFALLDVARYSEVSKLVSDFVSEIFCRDVPPSDLDRYNVSAAAAEILLGAGEGPIAGLFYPTVPMWGNGDNLVLKRGWAHENLRPVHAKFVRVTEVALPMMRCDVLDEARRFGPGGSIAWLGHEATWHGPPTGETYEFRAMNGNYWEALDGDGHVVDPT